MNINATLFVEVVIFIAFVQLTMHYIWPPLSKVLEERRLLIDQGIRNTEQAKQTLAEAKENAEAIILSAKEKAHLIENEAKKEASAYILAEKEKIEAARRRSQESLEASFQQQLNDARKKLHGEVTKLAVALCQKVLLQDSLDKKIQDNIISSYEEGSV